MNCCRDLFRAMVVLVLFCVLPMLASSCPWGTYSNCPEWGACSKTCGGGTQSRTCRSCFWGLRKTFVQPCHTWCYNGGVVWNYGWGLQCHCPAWRSGSCCEACRHVLIERCQSGQQECGGSPDAIRCTTCESGFHPAGYGQGCKACSNFTVDHCRPGKMDCSGSSSGGIRCLECEVGYVSGGYGKGCLEKTADGNTTELATIKNDTLVTSEDDDFAPETGTLVGIILGILAPIVIILTICCFWKRCYWYHCCAN